MENNDEFERYNTEISEIGIELTSKLLLGQVGNEGYVWIDCITSTNGISKVYMQKLLNIDNAFYISPHNKTGELEINYKFQITQKYDWLKLIHRNDF